jgi:L-threonylcarbamoyladenylate synthase
MSDVISREEFKHSPIKYLKQFKESVIVYPTDTIYGIGCNATIPALVSRIREMKHSHLQPFSVIAPSKEWIRENCVVEEAHEEWLERLPGPYTLIFKLKNPDCVAFNVINGYPSLGVRIPKHWFSDAVAKMGFPFVTTSANITAGEFMTSTDDLNSGIKNSADHILYEGQKEGHPSTLVHLDKDEIKIKERKVK